VIIATVVTQISFSKLVTSVDILKSHYSLSLDLQLKLLIKSKNKK